MRPALAQTIAVVKEDMVVAEGNVDLAIAEKEESMGAEGKAETVKKIVVAEEDERVTDEDEEKSQYLFIDI
jgi:hypothetical protein